MQRSERNQGPLATLHLNSTQPQPAGGARTAPAAQARGGGVSANETMPAAHGAAVPAEQRDPLLTAREVAERLGATPRWVLDRWAAGDLPGFRLTARMVRFRASEIDAWLESR